MTEVEVKVLKAIGYHDIHKAGEVIKVNAYDVASLVKDGYVELVDCDYQLKDGKLKVKVIDVNWDVIGVRSDNGEVDNFPIMYFNKEFYRIFETH